MGWAGGGDDDEIGTQTPRTISPQEREPFYSVFTYFRDGGPSYMMMVDDGDHGDDDA